jgi:glycosyltransferase involved in cell wall biosynthesis
MNTYALLVPCYNASGYLENFFFNINKQVKRFDEIIFYDDGSTDNTLQILKSNNFNVIEGHINKGSAYARNELLKQTACSWLHFHDCDDLLHPEYLLKTSKIAEDQKADVILCNVDWQNAVTCQIEISWRYSNEDIQTDPLAYTLSNPIGGINGLYYKEKLIDINGFDTSLRIWEDADLHVRLAAAKAKFYVIEETLSFSLRYGKSASSDQGKGWVYRYQALYKYFQLFQNHPILANIGREAEKTASGLILYNLPNESRLAFGLALKCGISIPTSKSILWKIIKRIVPDSLIIELRIFQLKKAFKNNFR